MTYPAWNGLPRNTLTFYTDEKSDHLYECLWISQQGWSMCNQSAATVSTYQQCLNANYGTVLTSCNPSVNTYNWPTANTYANCVNNGMSGGTRQNLNALKSCIKSDLWPLYEVPLDVDTGYFLGAFSWPLFMVTGLRARLPIFLVSPFNPVSQAPGSSWRSGSTRSTPWTLRTRRSSSWARRGRASPAWATCGWGSRPP